MLQRCVCGRGHAACHEIHRSWKRRDAGSRADPGGHVYDGRSVREYPESKWVSVRIAATGAALILGWVLYHKFRRKANYSLRALLFLVLAMNLILYGAVRGYFWAKNYNEYRKWIEKRTDDLSPHSVTLTHSFYCSVYPVTQRQYSQLIGSNPSKTIGALNPVDSVSWRDATDYCSRLSKQSHLDVRLPTEAEWEYCCRAGKGDAYDLADNDPAWGRFKECGFSEFASRYNITTSSRPVGLGQSNAFGLCDMLGTIGQWCLDCYYDKESNLEIDPLNYEQESSSPSDRIVRGGQRSMCASSREYLGSDNTTPWIGFRVVVALTPLKIDADATAAPDP